MYDESAGTEIVQPNKRLNEERLRKLQEIGFAWSAKHVRKQRNNSLQNSRPIDVPAQDDGITIPNSTAVVDNSAVSANTTSVAARTRKNDPRQTGRLNDQQWEEMYQRLVQFKQEHGDCLVPRKYERDPKLSTWVETQRVRLLAKGMCVFRFGLPNVLN